MTIDLWLPKLAVTRLCAALISASDYSKARINSVSYPLAPKQDFCRLTIKDYEGPATKDRQLRMITFLTNRTLSASESERS